MDEKEKMIHSLGWKNYTLKKEVSKMKMSVVKPNFVKLEQSERQGEEQEYAEESSMMKGELQVEVEPPLLRAVQPEAGPAPPLRVRPEVELLPATDPKPAQDQPATNPKPAQDQPATDAKPAQDQPATYRQYREAAGSAKTKPQNWICESLTCGYSNFGWRQKCYKCQAKLQDWICESPNCGFSNFGWRQTCYKCPAVKATEATKGQAVKVTEAAEGNLFIRGFDGDQAVLREAFGKFGRIVRLKVCGKPGPEAFAFVHYDNNPSAAQAIAALNGTVVGSGNIWVKWNEERPKRDCGPPKKVRLFSYNTTVLE
jgi:hypothetical protein